MNLGRVFVKDESSRLGLPAFKALGATWAIHRALADAPHTTTLVTATDGNHGRAVARTARQLGKRAHVLIPRASTRGPAARLHSPACARPDTCSRTSGRTP